MPADKQTALTALDAAFADAVKATYNEAIILLAGKDAAEKIERERLDTMLGNALTAYEWTAAAINKRFSVSGAGR